MDLLILLVSLAILTETSFLVFKKRRPVRSGKRKIYVDTSALIDGRILNIAKTGFMEGDLIILRDVLLELQLLADSKDIDKRNKGRAGLNAVSELERVVNINTEVVEEKADTNKVDEILLAVAKRNDGAILTIDYNLIKVAEAEKIETLNVNELTLAVKNEFTPGEKLEILITEKGSNQGQGVGHMPDGTMVIVDKAVNRIGQPVMVELMRLHETPSGKMIFAKIARKK